MRRSSGRWISVLYHRNTDWRKAGDMGIFADYFFQAKQAGLGITLHIAEVLLYFPDIL
jgi:hypothetical protein